MGVVSTPESKQSVSVKRAFRPSSSIRHTPQWYSSPHFLSETYNDLTFLTHHGSSKDDNFDNKLCLYVSRPVSDVTSDLTIEVGSASFSLHKVTKSKLNS